jgi:hypothetical protein
MVMDLYTLACSEDGDKSNIMEELDNCDSIIKTAMLKYEKNTRSEKDRAYWSPELEQSNWFVQFWNILYKSICQKVDASKRLETICQHLDDTLKMLICETQAP